MEYIAHHGIKGQKWGVRRYQNSDGSYTDAGRVRYGKQAARKYYKVDRLKRASENTTDFSKYRKLQKKIRKVETRYNRKTVGLTKTDIDKGRLAIASARVTRKKVRAVVGTATTAAGVAFMASNPVLGLAVTGISVGSTANAISKIPYYSMEKNMYKRRISEN